MGTRRVRIGTGVELAVAEAGAGGRPLLVVHGFGGAKEDFADHLGALGDRGWHAVAPDLRGHGASDWPPGERSYGFDAYAADLVALADALGWDRFAALGHSMGGMAVQHLALEQPRRLTGLVLMNTAHGPLEWLDPYLVEAGVNLVRTGGVAALVQAQRAMASDDDVPTSSAARRVAAERPGYQEFCDRKALATSADMRAAMLSAFLSQPDRLERLAGLDLPVLVLVGEEDVGFLLHSRRLAESLPGSRLVVIRGAGHSPQFEAPEAWWEAVAGFLDELAAVER